MLVDVQDYLARLSSQATFDDEKSDESDCLN